MTKLLCACKPRIERPMAPNVGPERASMVAVHSKLWASGTRLRYWIDPVMTGADRDVLHRSFSQWDSLVGLSIEVSSYRTNADFRIGFENDGSWSYVGRDNATIPTDQLTMNFGWSVAEDPDTALHEIGHALGMSHEHQSPHAGIEWNRRSVIRSLGGPPNNWSLAQIENNVFRKLPANAKGSNWDPNSIMEYPFEAGLIASPAEYSDGLDPEPGLSQLDVEWARKMYPSLLPETDDLQLDTSRQVVLEPGGQVAMSFVPPVNGIYTFETFGVNDTVLTLFDEDGEFVAGDDDSGGDKNARIEKGLAQGVRFTLRLRLFWSDAGEVAIKVTR